MVLALGNLLAFFEAWLSRFLRWLREGLFVKGPIQALCPDILKFLGREPSQGSMLSGRPS